MIPETVTSALPVEGGVGGSGPGTDGHRYLTRKGSTMRLIDNSQRGLAFFFFFFPS